LAFAGIDPKLQGVHLYSVMVAIQGVMVRLQRYSYGLGLLTHPKSIKLGSRDHMPLMQGSWKDFEVDGGKPLEGAGDAGWLLTATVMPECFSVMQQLVSKL
jgi:hypothetical protein